jgi:hypothetical protein
MDMKYWVEQRHQQEDVFHCGPYTVHGVVELPANQKQRNILSTHSASNIFRVQ